MDGMFLVDWRRVTVVSEQLTARRLEDVEVGLAPADSPFALGPSNADKQN